MSCISVQDLGEPLQLPKLGKKLYRLIHQFPKVSVSEYSSICVLVMTSCRIILLQLELQAQVQPITRSILKVELTITPDFEFAPEFHSAG